MCAVPRCFPVTYVRMCGTYFLRACVCIVFLIGWVGLGILDQFDILEGKNANVWTVGVASGPGAMARKNMVKSGPDFVIDNVSELRTLWTTKLPPSAPVAGRSQRRGSMASPPAAAAASASAAALAGRSAMSPPPTAPAPSRQRRGSELRTGTPADTAANGSATIAASLLPPPAVEVAAAAPSADRADVRVGAIAEGNST